MTDVVVGGRYRIKHKIGGGSFGEIYLGVDLRTGEEYAVKVESISTKYPQLQYEYRVYRSIKKTVGFPVIRWFGPAGRW